MTEEHTSNSEIGLSLGTKAPIIDTNDIFENKINLTTLLQNYQGVLLDFFRGAW